MLLDSSRSTGRNVGICQRGAGNHPLMMPSTLCQPISDKGSVLLGIRCLLPAAMPPHVAPLAGCGDVGLGITTAILPCQEMLGGTLERASLSHGDPVDFGKKPRILDPHRDAAVAAATLLPDEGLRTETGEF